MSVPFSWFHWGAKVLTVSVCKLLSSRGGRPVETLVIQENSGTQNTVNLGRTWIEKTLSDLEDQPRKNTPIRELIVGTICGGSDGTSGITANPAVGHAFDRLIDQ